jgi:hypothetical protein
MVSKFKAIEIEVSWSDYAILSAGVDMHIRRDHAGLQVDATILGLCLSFNFYDTRHWDRSKGQYETHSKEV